MQEGRCLRVERLSHGLVELCFDRADRAVNALDAATRTEFAAAIESLKHWPGLRGVLISSAKTSFIVGADISEFGAFFQQDETAITNAMMVMNDLLCGLEDLRVPTVAAISGDALGGGLEVALACSLRVMSTQARVGLPEVNLGLLPGYGGTVRLTRIAGPAVAIDWILSGRHISANAALEAGVADLIAAPDDLRETALALLERAANPAADCSLDTGTRQELKCRPIDMISDALDGLFEPARLQAQSRALSHQPAALIGLEMMREACASPRQIALRLEAAAFARVAKTQAAAALVQFFLNQQTVRKTARMAAKDAGPIRRIAVLGAGIMGAGIAFASARRGVQVDLVDINPEALDRGIREISFQFGGLVNAGVLDAEAAASALALVTPRLSIAGCESADLIIESISENLNLKRQVLADLESRLPSSTLFATNTSGLRIADIAAGLQRPENLVAMHFFNPVRTMPLVEVGRGRQSAPSVVASVVGFAQALGKTPILVGDSPGFLVNRVFTAYMQGFQQLLMDGADFIEVDRVMEAFGWPLGPAGLQDMLGLDICLEAGLAISAGYPASLPRYEEGPLALLVRVKRLGRKSGAGFYRYDSQPRGPRRKVNDASVHELMATVQARGRRHFDSAEIIDRLMLAMVLEACRTLDEGVAGSAAELDLALLTGAGMPAYLGGPLNYADWLGAREIVERADRLADLGAMYQPPNCLREMARQGTRYYPV